MACSVFDAIAYEALLEGTDREPHLRRSSRWSAARVVAGMPRFEFTSSARDHEIAICSKSTVLAG